MEEAAKVALLLEQYPLGERRCTLDDAREQFGGPQRKARIVLVLLKRHGLVREHRGGGWERLRNNLTACDLSADLIDYEERRVQDQAKLQSMISYCQTAQCRTRYILEYFGEDVRAGLGLRQLRCVRRDGAVGRATTGGDGLTCFESSCCRSRKIL